MVFDYTKIREMPPIVRALCFLHDAWVVGGAAKWLVGDTKELKDWDIIVPIRHWTDAQHLIPYGTKSNTFGGFKIAGDIEIDIWAEDLDHLFLTADKGPGIAVQPRRKVVVGIL